MPREAKPGAAKAANGNRPVQVLRHRSLKVSIWRNDTAKGPMFNVIAIRAYKDPKSGEWKDSNSFGYDDLMNVAALMYEAHGVISSLRAKNAGVKASNGRK